MFIVDEIRKRDPDSFEVLDRLFYEFGDREFQLRPDFCREISGPDWPEPRLYGALTRLFAREFLVSVETLKQPSRRDVRRDPHWKDIIRGSPEDNNPLHQQ